MEDYKSKHTGEAIDMLLDPASKSKRGTVKIGLNLVVDSEGVVDVNEDALKVKVVDSFASDSTEDALSARKGKELKTILDALNVPQVVDNLVTNDDKKALSAKQGTKLKGMIDGVISSVEPIDSLTSTDSGKPLSANMGRVLNQKIESIPSGGTVEIVDNLNSTETGKALSANMGRELKERVDGITPVVVSDVLNSNSATDALSANQGRVLDEKISNIRVVEVVDDLVTDDSQKALSASRGVELKRQIDAIPAPIVVKNDLVSDDPNAALSARQGFLLKQMVDNIPSGGTPIVADEEDLTVNGGKMYLKDSEYNPAVFSGLGRTILRKNIQGGKNILEQGKLSKESTRYIIKHDFDLNGKTIVIPNGCVLSFEGGSFKNGAIKGAGVIIESSYPCFDKTVVILPDTLKDGVLNLGWFKMERWTVAQYTANHKNSTNPVVSDTNRMIVNKHLKYRLIVPSGIFPFDNQISLIETFSEYGSSYDSGCSLNIEGVPFSEFTGKFMRSAFVFPKSRGFYWYKGTGNMISNIRNMYFESYDNVFHVWGNFNINDMENTRTPNAVTNLDVFNIEMVSWNGNGFYSPANWATYIFYNRYRYIKGWFPKEGTAFWNGMCNMCNMYDNVTLLYMGMDDVGFTGDNYSVFINQSAYLNQGNFDRSRYILHYAGTGTEFKKRYENQGAFFHATRCNFEGLKDEVVYTGGEFVSIGISIDGTELAWYPNATIKPIFNVSRLNYFRLNTHNTVGVPENMMLKVNSTFGGKNVIDADTRLKVSFEGNTTLLVPARQSSAVKDEHMSFITLTGRTKPNYSEASRVDFLSAGVMFTEAQEITDAVNIANANETLKSTNLIFKRTQPLILPHITPVTSYYSARNFEGAHFNITNEGAMLWIVTDRGNIEVPKGVSVNLMWSIAGFKVVDVSPKALKADNSCFPIVYDGDSILSADKNKQLIITQRNCGLLAVGGAMKRNTNYNSVIHGSTVYAQNFGVSNTAIIGTNVYCCIKTGSTAATQPAFNSTQGAETADGSTLWRCMGVLPTYKEKVI